MSTQNETPARQPVVTHVDVELAKAVREAAAKDQRTVAGWVRRILTEHLAQDDDHV